MRSRVFLLEVLVCLLFTAAGLVPAGTFVNVRITGASDGDLTGEIEE